MAFNQYTSEARTLTITRDDPWGTHVGYDTKRTGVNVTGWPMSNYRFAEIRRRIGFPLALEAKVEMMTTLSALRKIPEKFKLGDDDALAWRTVTHEIGSVYCHEKSYFDRMIRPLGTSIVTSAEMAEVHNQMAERMQSSDCATRDAAERIATWIELAGLVKMPEDFAARQYNLFIHPPESKEKMWDYTGVQIW